MSAWDGLAAFFNDPANGTTLAAFGVAAVLLAAALVWACWRLGNLPGRRRPTNRPDAFEGRDIHPPTQLDRILRDELGREVGDLEAEWQRLNGERDR